MKVKQTGTDNQEGAVFVRMEYRISRGDKGETKIETKASLSADGSLQAVVYDVENIKGTVTIRMYDARGKKIEKLALKKEDIAGALVGKGIQALLDAGAKGLRKSVAAKKDEMKAQLSPGTKGVSNAITVKKKAAAKKDEMKAQFGPSTKGVSNAIEAKKKTAAKKDEIKAQFGPSTKGVSNAITANKKTAVKKGEMKAQFGPSSKGVSNAITVKKKEAVKRFGPGSKGVRVD
jgi:hypothetical protein